MKKWAVTGILLGIGMLSMAWSSINMSLSEIQGELDATVLQLQWMMNVYGIFVCIPLLTVGKLGDAYGRKKFYLAGLGGLGLACLGAGFARSAEWIVGCMGLFGISAAAILTLSQALTVHQFPENEKGRAVAIWATVSSFSLAVGPLVGGIFLRYLSWHWMFFFVAFVAFVSLLLVAFFVGQDTTRSTHCDWSGVGLLALIVGALVTAILQGPNWGWNSWTERGLFGLVAIAIGCFIYIERRSKEPMFRPDLFSQRNFLVSAICNGCFVGFLWSVFFYVPLSLQNEQNATGLQTGLIMLLITVPVALLSIPVVKLYEKIDAKPLLMVGFSLLFLAVFFQEKISFPVSCLLIGLGWVFTWGPSTSKALSALPHHQAGIASGMFMTLQEIGGVLGLAISSVVFRVGLNRQLVPAMDQIQSILGDKTPSLLSDPSAAGELVGNDSPLVALLRQGFLAGYNDMLSFLCLLSLGALVLSLFLPKNGLPQR